VWIGLLVSAAFAAVASTSLQQPPPVHLTSEQDHQRTMDAAHYFAAAERRQRSEIAVSGELFDEGTLGSVGLALEKSFGVVGERPPGF
jgi:hypothetical protein